MKFSVGFLLALMAVALVLVTAKEPDAEEKLCQQRYLLIDITIPCDVTEAQLLDSLPGLDVLYVFNVPLTKRYIINIRQNGNILPLQRLKIPSVATKVYRAERSDHFYSRFGADVSYCNNLKPLTGGDITLVDVDLLMTGMNRTEYEATLKTMGDQLQQLHKEYTVHGFSVLGQVPPKILSFDNNAENVVSSFMKLVGSPHAFTVNTTPIIRVY